MLSVCFTKTAEMALLRMASDVNCLLIVKCKITWTKLISTTEIYKNFMALVGEPRGLFFFLEVYLCYMMYTINSLESPGNIAAFPCESYAGVLTLRPNAPNETYRVNGPWGIEEILLKRILYAALYEFLNENMPDKVGTNDSPYPHEIIFFSLTCCDWGLIRNYGDTIFRRW